MVENGQPFALSLETLRGLFPFLFFLSFFFFAFSSQN